MASHHRRKKGDKFCPKHPKKELTFSCDDCADTPVCSLCITTDHKGHKFTDLDSLAQAKYNFIQDFNNEIKTQIIPKIENNLQHADVSMGTFEQSIAVDIDRVEGQRNYLKKKIDSVADKNISDLKDICKRYQTLVQQFKSATENSRKRMQNLFAENSDALKSNQNILLIDVAEDLKGIKTEPPHFCDIPSAEFLSGSKPDCERLIHEAFGYIHKMNQSGDLLGAKAPHKSPTLDGEIKVLLTKPSLLNTRKLSFNPYAAEITKDGTICLCAHGRIHLLDTNGGMRYFKLDSDVRDIAVHPVSDDVYCTLGDNSVRLLDTSTGSTTKLFVPEGRHDALAFMNDGSLLVSEYDKPLVTLYSDKSKKIRTFTYKGRGPRQITVCRTTGRIAIACWRSNVLVIDSNFTELYRYSGYSGDSTLESYDVVFDGLGHLLVADYRENKGIHVLNAETGQHIQTMTTDNMGLSKCLTINHDGHLVVGTCDPNRLLPFKYLD